MAVKTKIIYSKKFISKTDKEDLAYHGSPMWHYFQAITDEDEEIRGKLLTNFALTEDEHIYQGSDGKFNYIFRISQQIREIEHEPKKNVEYETKIHLSKSGKEEELEKLSDLEAFLLGKGFKRIEKN